MKKALIVGIDYYENAKPLYGCVNDAYSVKSVMERNSDGTINFDVRLEVSSNSTSAITRSKLKIMISDLFKDDSEIALLYFAGHGYVENTGGYLITSECLNGDDGLPLSELLHIANSSKSKNRIVILDCCHAGYVGKTPGLDDKSILSEGMTILTSSSEDQYSVEENGSGVFTSLFVDAMNGSAANLLGEITPGSVYSHIDRSLGPWDQRPIFKTNVKSFVSLRKVQSPISLSDLKELTVLFPNKGNSFTLDRTFEPTEESCIPENAEKFALLQKFNRINLVTPIDEEHMYFAAINGKGCRLTILGEHYWNLVKRNRV